jgi:hypothetical protein
MLEKNGRINKSFPVVLYIVLKSLKLTVTNETDIKCNC